MKKVSTKQPATCYGNFHNTQLINAGSQEEIREHVIGHKLKDRVRDAYFLAYPDEPPKSYLSFNMKSSPVYFHG